MHPVGRFLLEDEVAPTIVEGVKVETVVNHSRPGPQVSEPGEGGLKGIALHPDFATPPCLYAAHSYNDNGALGNQIVRLRWDGQSLGEPEVPLSNIPRGHSRRLAPRDRPRPAPVHDDR